MSLRKIWMVLLLIPAGCFTATTPRDAGFDAGTPHSDAGGDAGPPDGGPDSGVDAGRDGGEHGPTDAGVDAGLDAGGGQDSGVNSINIVFTVDVHPAALQALMNYQLPIPNLVSGGYLLTLNGLSLNGLSVQTTSLGSQVIRQPDAGPYIFVVPNPQNYELGLLAAILPVVDAGIPPLPCSFFVARDAGVDAGIDPRALDLFVISAMLPTVTLSPPDSDISTTIYGIPASYLALLSCAAGEAADGGLLAQGVDLLYASVLPAGKGAASANVAFNTGGSGNLIYYAPDDRGVGNGATSSTGIATLSAVSAGFGFPSSIDASQNGGPSRVIGPAQTVPGTVLEEFFSPP